MQLSWKKIGLAVALVVLLLVSGFVIWASFPLGPAETAEDALESTDNVTVSEEHGFISFSPTSGNISTGLIFYPGGRVAEESYAPLAQQIAEYGFLVVIVPMPLNLAIFGIGKAQDVIDTYPTISIWALSGHSLGGSMASSFVADNSGVVQALYLLASYPTESSSLADHQDLEVLSIYGTEDRVLSTNIEDTAKYLPPDAEIIPIEGGNHAYFGNYGEQPGDGEATISRQEQQHITTDLITDSLTSLQ